MSEARHLPGRCLAALIYPHRTNAVLFATRLPFPTQPALRQQPTNFRMLLLGKGKARHKAHADQRPNRRQQANPEEQPRQHAIALGLRLRHIVDHRQKHAD